MKRQTAWRVFAGEFNDSTVEIKGEGEMTPSYVVTPLGAKVNRVFIIGVLTDVENVSEDGELLTRDQSDPIKNLLEKELLARIKKDASKFPITLEIKIIRGVN